MDSILKRNKKLNKWIPYLVIILIAGLFEVVIGNFSTFSSRTLEKQILAENVQTDSRGIYHTEVISMDKEVENVYVKLDLERIEEAKVTVTLTDEGDKYPYNLPEITVIPTEPTTFDTNIYPYGKVHSIEVSVTVPEGTAAHIQEISINAQHPFSFKWIRFVVLVAVMIFLWSIRDASAIHDYYCERKNKKQMLITAGTLFAVIIMGFILVNINPVLKDSPWLHHHQYQELAHALAEGDVKLPFPPSKGLLEAENPYDTSALMAENTEFRMDYAYYNGHYYVYFGIVPELLFFLPYYLMTGTDLSNYVVIFVLYVGFAVGVFGLLWEFLWRYGKKVPFFHYILLSSGVCLFGNYVYMAARPDIYHIPVLAGNCFTVLGLYCWLKGLAWKQDRTPAWKRRSAIAIGSLFMAMVAGCRPQMLLYSLVAVVLFLPVGEDKKEFSLKKSWKDICAFCIPYGLVAILVFWYNAARFDSGFNFGATYSLTSNDMNHRGFSFVRIFQGLYNFLFQPPVINSDFPFLYSNELDGGFMGKSITEFTFGGIFATNIFLWGIFYRIFLWKQKISKNAQWLIYTLCGISLVLVFFDVNGAGILQRYMGDMVLGFILAAVLSWFLILSRQEKNTGYYVFSKVLCVSMLMGFTYSFLVVLAKGDSVCLQNYNMPLFYRIADYFVF